MRRGRGAAAMMAAALLCVLCPARDARAELVVSYSGDLVLAGSAITSGKPAPGFGLLVISRRHVTPYSAVLASVGVRSDASDWTSGSIMPGPVVLSLPPERGDPASANGGYTNATLYEMTVGARFSEPDWRLAPFAEAVLGVAAIDAGDQRGDLLAGLSAGLVWRIATQLEASASVGERLYFTTSHAVVPLSLAIGCSLR